MSSYHSCGMRVFRGCRALLAPAKSAAADVANAKSTTTTARSKPKPKPRPAKAINQVTGTGLSSPKLKAPKRETAGPRGILKSVPISPALQTFMGVPEASRSGAVKQIWSYIKSQNLQNPADKREIFCDEKLKALFSGKDKVGFLEIGKLLSLHFVKTN
ncbi:protein TRI1-like [Corylus avellana]|uniref:protein TRI1-like n=1 Tax=Corylus avellana TaxID=13451 RepID=UPI00286CEB52|nr:protein TRI1-like [Corylus avellana]